MSYSAAYDIPLELLTYIFTIARRDVTRWGSFAYTSSDAYELGLALSGVCRYFRRTVRGMPEFWDKISVSGRGHDQAFRRLLTCLAAVPEASLDIRFYISQTSYPEKEEEEQDEDEEDYEESDEDDTVHEDEPHDHRARFFIAIAAQAHRLRRLEFRFKFKTEWEAMTGCFQYIRATSLEHLTIEADFFISSWDKDFDDNVTLKAFLFKGGAPSLREVRLSGLGFTRATTPVSSLSTLVIVDPNFTTVDGYGDLELMLEKATSLRVLHLYGERWFDTCTSEWTVGAPEYSTIYTSSLRELKLDAYTECLLEILEMPYLTKLILESISADVFVEFLSSSIGPPFPFLKHLVLENPKWAELHAEQYNTIMAKIPKLQYLAAVSWMDSGDNDAVIDALTKRVGAWRFLHTLEISGMRKTTMMKLIHSRQFDGVIRTLVVPVTFLNIMKKHSPGVVKEIESAGFRIKPRASLSSYGEEGRGYWESWVGQSGAQAPGEYAHLRSSDYH
jgi:hypothetical protein